MAVLVGLSFQAFRSTSPATSTATLQSVTWTQFTNCKDMTLGGTATKVDISDRSSNFKRSFTALIDAGVSFEMNYDTTDTVMLALQTAFAAGSQLYLAFMDSAVAGVPPSGAVGIGGTWSVEKFEKTAALDGEAKVSITVNPGTFAGIFTKS